MITPALAWILLGEFSLISLAIILIALWRGRRRQKKMFAAAEELLTRMRKQQDDRVARRAESLQSALQLSPEAARETAEIAICAEREFAGALLAPLLKDDLDFAQALDRTLYRFSDQQFGALIDAIDQETAPADLSTDTAESDQDIPEEGPAEECADTEEQASGDAAAEDLLPPLGDLDEPPDPFASPALPEQAAQVPAEETVDAEMAELLRQFGMSADDLAAAETPESKAPVMAASPAETPQAPDEWEDTAQGFFKEAESETSGAAIPAAESPPAKPQTQEEIDADIAAKLRELEEAVNGLDVAPAAASEQLAETVHPAESPEMPPANEGGDIPQNFSVEAENIPSGAAMPAESPPAKPRPQEEIDADIAAKLRELEEAVNGLDVTPPAAPHQPAEPVNPAESPEEFPGVEPSGENLPGLGETPESTPEASEKAVLREAEPDAGEEDSSQRISEEPAAEHHTEVPAAGEPAPPLEELEVPAAAERPRKSKPRGKKKKNAEPTQGDGDPEQPG